MNILVIGTGAMGSAFVKQLNGAGHRVSVTARDAAKAAALAGRYPGVQAVPVKDAANGHDVVIVATGYGDAATALRNVGSLSDKVVVDITNPLSADYMSLLVGHDTSAAEEIARAIPGAHVVKAFNTVFAQVLDDGARLPGGAKVSAFYAGDSDRAKATVRELAESMGFDPIDAGGLKNARYLEPLAGLNIYLGYGAGLGTGIAPTWAGRS